MSSTRIKRAKAPQRRPARTPKKRRKVQASRLDAFINALPVSTATLQRVANWTIGVSLAALIAVGAHATGVTAKINEEWEIGRAHVCTSVPNANLVCSHQSEIHNIYKRI